MKAIEDLLASLETEDDARYEARRTAVVAVLRAHFCLFGDGDWPPISPRQAVGALDMDELAISEHVAKIVEIIGPKVAL